MILIVSALSGCCLGGFYTVALCAAISLAYYKKQELTIERFDSEKPADEEIELKGENADEKKADEDSVSSFVDSGTRSEEIVVDGKKETKAERKKRKTLAN